MARYYFDIQDGNEVFSDDVGIELNTLQLARNEAVGTLAEIARDTIRQLSDLTSCQKAISVRTDERHVMEARIIFEVEMK